MRKQYDFGNATKNPYAQRLKRPVTIRLDSRKRLSLRWKARSKQGAA